MCVCVCERVCVCVRACVRLCACVLNMNTNRNGSHLIRSARKLGRMERERGVLFTLAANLDKAEPWRAFVNAIKQRKQCDRQMTCVW